MIIGLTIVYHEVDDVISMIMSQQIQIGTGEEPCVPLCTTRHTLCIDAAITSCQLRWSRSHLSHVLCQSFG